MIADALAEAKQRVAFRQIQQAAITRTQLHDAQALVVSQAKRFNVVDCGRRWGKSLMGMDLAVEPLQAGYPVGWFSPKYKDMLEVWDDLVSTFRDVIKRKNATERRLEMITGGVLECWSLEDADAGRSRAYKRVIIDEAAKAPKLQATWENAIRPTLADYVGDGWFLSTPRGRNYFWQLWQRGQDPLDQDGFMSWKLPTSTNPYIDPEEIEAARRELPESVFEQEYLAEFTESAMLFRNVRECVGEYQHIAENNHVSGLDWAQMNDFTVIATMDARTKQVAPLNRFNQIAWQVQRDRVVTETEQYKTNYILAEQNSIGSPNIEALQALGLPVTAFVTTNESKSEIIQALMLAFERKEITIPADSVLIGELEAFEATRLPSGKWKYSAPDGMHDDTVIALALAWWAASANPYGGIWL